MNGAISIPTIRTETKSRGVESDGTANVPSAHAIDINFRCLAGPNDKIDVLDSCPDLFFRAGFADSHVINCKEAPSLP
jgi:hypothetical protein